MKPNLQRVAIRTLERFVVVMVVAPSLHWLFTGTIVVPWAIVLCVMTGVVLYDLLRFAVDAHKHEGQPPNMDGKARPVAVLTVLGALSVAACVALLWWRPARAEIREPSGLTYTAHRYPMEPRSLFVQRVLGDVEALTGER